ncbi:MAG: response regulator [Bradymonadaceae bacterium]|nr:response regulator [Lujinxingiaceae bacterium]
MSDSPTHDELNGYRQLYEFSQKVLSKYDLSELLETLVDSIIGITGADNVMLFLLEDGRPVVRVARNLEGKNLAASEQQFSESLVQKVLSTRQALMLSDAVNDIDLGKVPSVFDLSIRSVLCVPMFDHGSLLGLLYVCNQTYPDLFNERHLKLVSIFGLQASLLIAEALRVNSLTESEQRHRSLVELFPEAIAVYQGERIVFVNSAGVSLLAGESSAGVIDHGLLAFLPDPQSLGIPEWLVGLGAHEALQAVEIELRRLDGELIAVEISAAPINYRGEQAMQLVMRDVTHRTAMLAERMRMDRLVTMGTLAAGMGHEINNPLSYVHTNMDFAQNTLTETIETLEKVHAGEKALSKHEMATLIESLRESRMGLDSGLEGTARIRDVVRSIQSFSRLDEGESALVRIEKPLEFSIKIAQSEMRYRARLVRDLQVTPLVEANESRLGQVFLNLLINAAHAIPEGDPDANEICVSSRIANGWIVVEVRDSGSGIPNHLMRRVFEPFVTTKSNGQGTGLGLAISKSIIEGLGGRIEVESELGKGTCFRVLLPEARAKNSDKQVKKDTAPRAGRARVLVVDDELRVGASLRRVLSGEYEVEVATSGQSALEMLKAGPAYDVIICDLMMPEMSGIDLHNRLEKSGSPYVQRMIFMTGGVFSTHEQLFLRGLKQSWLSKPIDIGELKHQISRRAAKG